MTRRNFAQSTPHAALAFVIALAHLLPWAVHHTAALTLSGNDLAFFTHFTPGAGIFRNEWFYLPVGAAAIQVVLATRRRKLVYRLMAFALAVFVIGLALPRYQFLVAFRGAIRAQGLFVALGEFEFGLQVVLALIFMVIVAGLTLWPRAEDGHNMRSPASNRPILLVILLELLCLGLCLVPLVGLLSVRPAIEALYKDTITLGIGWWFVLLAVFGLALSVGAKIKSAFQS